MLPLFKNWSIGKSTIFKLQTRFRDGPVGPEFMSNNASEAEEMPEQMLAFDCNEHRAGGKGVVSGFIAFFCSL